MKRITKFLLVTIAALSMILLCGCGAAESLAGAVADTVNSVKDEAISTITNAVDEYMDSTGASDRLDSVFGDESESSSEEDYVSSESSYEDVESDVYADDYQEEYYVETPEDELSDALEEEDVDVSDITVSEDGEYIDKDHVALYIHTYGCLPSNFVTKKEAEAAGWDSRSGNLNTILPGKSIGGNRYGNYEGLLPQADGRQYYECDINYNPDGITDEPVYRGSERIIYSNDGLVFYTCDHYESFEQLF